MPRLKYKITEPDQYRAGKDASAGGISKSVVVFNRVVVKFDLDHEEGGLEIYDPSYGTWRWVEGMTQLQNEYDCWMDHKDHPEGHWLAPILWVDNPYEVRMMVMERFDPYTTCLYNDKWKSLSSRWWHAAQAMATMAGDLHTYNIGWTEDGEPRLIDYGMPAVDNEHKDSYWASLKEYHAKSCKKSEARSKAARNRARNSKGRFTKRKAAA
jgi:hypothetical protein